MKLERCLVVALPHKFLHLPQRALTYPVFDSLDPRTRKVSGILSSAVMWKILFSRILPQRARGIMCVLSNNFNQTFTYRIDGAEARYVGQGDRHDEKYNHLVHSANLNDYVAAISSKATKSYTSVDLNNNFGRYYLRVYPSAETEAEFRDNRPIHHTIAVFGMILFSSTVFLLYDYVVKRRQKIVMDRAISSGAIVSSLFPDHVKEKLYQTTQRRASMKKDASSAFLRKEPDQDVVSAETESGAIIADHYPDATILFADIAG